jgi:hypothetical protein
MAHLFGVVIPDGSAGRSLRVIHLRHHIIKWRSNLAS